MHMQSHKQQIIPSPYIPTHIHTYIHTFTASSLFEERRRTCSLASNKWIDNPGMMPSKEWEPCMPPGMSVCMYVCMVKVYLEPCMPPGMCVCLSVCMYVYVYTIYMYVCMYECMYGESICVYACMYVCTYGEGMFVF